MKATIAIRKPVDKTKLDDPHVFQAKRNPSVKTTALICCITSALGSLSSAQQPASSPPKAMQAGIENYVVTLTMTDKAQKTSDLSLVAASADFSTSFLDAQGSIVKLVCTLTPEEGDVVSVRYALGSEIPVSSPPNATMYKSIATQATVRLKLGEPVQILKSDTQTCTLKVARLSDQPSGSK